MINVTKPGLVRICCVFEKPAVFDNFFTAIIKIIHCSGWTKREKEIHETKTEKQEKTCSEPVDTRNGFEIHGYQCDHAFTTAAIQNLAAESGVLIDLGWVRGLELVVYGVVCGIGFGQVGRARCLCVRECGSKVREVFVCGRKSVHQGAGSVLWCQLVKRTQLTTEVPVVSEDLGSPCTWSGINNATPSGLIYLVKIFMRSSITKLQNICLNVHLDRSLSIIIQRMLLFFCPLEMFLVHDLLRTQANLK